MSQTSNVAHIFDVLRFRSRFKRTVLLSTLGLSISAIAFAASAPPAGFQRAQYEVYEEPSAPSAQQTTGEQSWHLDQQSAPREPASDLQTVANQQTPSELQSHSDQEKSEQASAPPSAGEQPNAFVSGKSNEPQDVAQTEAQSREQSSAQGEQASPSQEQKSEQPAAENQQAPPPAETKSGEDEDPNNQ